MRSRRMTRQTEPICPTAHTQLIRDTAAARPTYGWVFVNEFVVSSTGLSVGYGLDVRRTQIVGGTKCLCLHVVEEFFVDDLAVGDLIDGDLFHCEPFASRLERRVHLESHREMRTRHERTFDTYRVDVVVSGPPLALGHYGGRPFDSCDGPGGAPASMLTISGE